jgi:hypothetical protein
VYTDRTSEQGPRPPWVQTGPLGRVPDPWDGSRTPLRGVRATHSRVPGFWDKEYPDLTQDQTGVWSQHVFGPCRVRFCSPLRRRPDAATWPTAHDVSQRAELDIRPLGRATSAFNADKPCRLSIPLAGDVPPRTCRGSVSLYVPPLSYKREGTQRYKADPT